MLIRESTSHVVFCPARLIALIASAVVCVVLCAPQALAAQADNAAAQEVVAMINGWRIEAGLWPLRVNETLTRMATDQANYVLSLPDIPSGGNIHLGANGLGPAERARLPQYNWTPYGNDRNTAVGEIAYVGVNAAAARRFWEGSTVHRTALLNPAYREIGVVALPHRFGRLYMVDFGSRPDVFPAIADVRTNTLYLSNERYTWARSPFIRDVARVRLFDADGRSLEPDWIPWQLRIPLPPNAGNLIYVAYTDGAQGMVLSPVALDGQASGLPAVPVVPTAAPSATPAGISSPTPALPSATGTPVFAATATPVFSSTSTPTSPSTSNVIVLYDARALSLINTGQRALDVSEVVFVRPDQSFAVSRWATEWLSGSLTALPGGDCLGVWSWNEGGMLEKPTQCRQRRGVLTIAPDRLFWMRGDFEVHWRGAVLATCRLGGNRCEFVLP